MATRLAIREQQLATWTAIIQECRNSGMKTKRIICVQMSHLSGGREPLFRFAMSHHSCHNEPLVL